LIIFILSWFIHITTCHNRFFFICYHNNIKRDNNSWTVSSHKHNLPVLAVLISPSVACIGVVFVCVVGAWVVVVGVVGAGVVVVGVVGAGVLRW
jgi:glucose-6-phosphate-specific signal transduction histidine kinase